MTRRAHLEDGKWVHDETMEAYVVRTLAENQARVDILPRSNQPPEHILTTRSIPDIVERKGYMKVLDEYETAELIHDADIGLVETAYARYDSQTNTVSVTIKLKDGKMPPYLLDRQLRPIDPKEIVKG